MDNPAHHAAHEETSDEICGSCGYTFPVLGIFEYGKWSPYDTDDLTCPDCGANIMEDG